MKKSRQLFYLLTNSFLHIICCALSFYFNNGDKFSLAPAGALLEFFIIHWCAWNSVLTLIYNWREINFLLQSSLSDQEKKQKKLSLVVAVSNLTSLAGFISVLPILLKKGKLDSVPLWINSAIWHFLVLPMSLFYFFLFVKPKKIEKKKLFYLMLPLPVIFFLANLVRRFFLVNPRQEVKFRRFAIWWFKHMENKEHAWLLFWIGFSIFYFWLTAYLLLKIKQFFFRPAKKNENYH